MKHYYIQTLRGATFSLTALNAMSGGAIVSVVDTLDFTEEKVFCRDIVNFYSKSDENASRFINVNGKNAVVVASKPVTSIKIRDGSIFSSDDYCVLNIHYRGIEYRFIQLKYLEEKRVVLVEYNKVTHEYSAMTGQIVGQMYPLTILRNISVLEGNLRVTLAGNIRVMIDNERVSLVNKNYKFTRLSDYLNDIVRGFESSGEIDVFETPSLVKDLFLLDKYYPIEKVVAKKILDTCLNNLLHPSVVELIHEEHLEKQITYLANKYCDKQRQAKVAKVIFMRKG